jgi:hypothetical protein
MEENPPSIPAPDYSATLGTIAHNLNAYGAMVKAMRQSPALRLTPDELATRIATAGEQARAEDRGTIARSRETLDRAAEKLERLAVAVATIDEQRCHLFFAIIAGAIAGVLLWSFLLDAIARALPPDWRIPESMATRTLGASSPWEAGSHLMQTGDPHAWAALNEASDFLRDNRETIAACRKSSGKAKRTTQCIVSIRQGE